MEKIIEILEMIKPGIDYKNETALVDDGLLDSLNVVSLVFELNEQFGITVSIIELQPENFNTVQAIYELVERLKNEN